MNQNKGFMSVLTAVVVTALLVGGAMYVWHLQQTNKDLSLLVAQKNQVVKVASPTAMLKTSVTPSVQPNQLGTISGTMIYPASQMPPNMKVCIEKTENKELVKCTSEKAGDPTKPTLNTFVLQAPIGKYYVYAMLPGGFGSNPNYKAYYNDFVTCGLKYGCPSHAPIAIVVNAGESVKDIKPHDWYDDTQQTPSVTP